ncbi:hypothetical protein Acsp05_66470 [Actinokineospora sp. NBRC 105648]|nr:hypothetical protein Acsp05_66470 [Actinokineospora sp. NBRC 105648]
MRWPGMVAGSGIGRWRLRPRRWWVVAAEGDGGGAVGADAVAGVVVVASGLVTGVYRGPIGT